MNKGGLPKGAAVQAIKTLVGAPTLPDPVIQSTVGDTAPAEAPEPTDPPAEEPARSRATSSCCSAPMKTEVKVSKEDNSETEIVICKECGEITTPVIQMLGI